MAVAETEIKIPRAFKHLVPQDVVVSRNFAVTLNRTVEIAGSLTSPLNHSRIRPPQGVMAAIEADNLLAKILTERGADLAQVREQALRAFLDSQRNSENRRHGQGKEIISATVTSPIPTRKMEQIFQLAVDSLTLDDPILTTVKWLNAAVLHKDNGAARALEATVPGLVLGRRNAFSRMAVLENLQDVEMAVALPL